MNTRREPSNNVRRGDFLKDCNELCINHNCTCRCHKIHKMGGN